MSWLSEFTSKAENLLNKIDQSAATTFNESTNVVSPDQHIGEINVAKEPQNFASTKYVPPTSLVNKTFDSQEKKHPVHLTLNNSAETSQPSNQGIKTEIQTNLARSSSSPSLNKKEDDLLFEFLNSNNPVTVKKGHVRNLSGPKTSTPRKTLPLSSNASSSRPVPSTQPAEQKQNDAVDSAPPVMSAQKSEKDITDRSKKENEKDRSDQSQQHRNDEANKIDATRISNLELENKLLKNEMHSLNEELASTLTKLKEQQQETEKYKLRYDNRRSQQNEDYERIQKEFESKEVDLTEALKAKDSQLAVLRVRIQEVDMELQKKTKTLEEVQEQNERLFKDHSDSTGVQSVALYNIKFKLEEAEDHLRLERNEKENIKSELMNLQTKRQSEQRQYTETIKQLQARQSEGRDKSREIEVKLKQSGDAANIARKELKDYKDKAARILQAKEKLINSLRQGTDLTEASPVLLSELEETKQERDALRDELQQTKYNLEKVRSEYLDLELLHNSEYDENQQRIDSLQSSLQDESQKRQHAEEDMKRYMQELQFTREDLHKIKKSQISQTQQHETEMKKLQQHVTAKVKQNTNSSQDELENRIRTLTDSLIHKQTMVEALSTEKNSLVLQLERLEKQYHDVQSSLTRRNKDHSTDIEDPESGSRLQPMASIMPSQITQNMHWKKTVNDIDKFSIRLGVFLRRYPIARLMVIVYMFILHLWVTFVLLTYTPEMHTSDPHSPKDPHS